MLPPLRIYLGKERHLAAAIITNSNGKTSRVITGAYITDAKYKRAARRIYLEGITIVTTIGGYLLTRDKILSMLSIYRQNPILKERWLDRVNRITKIIGENVKGIAILCG